MLNQRSILPSFHPHVLTCHASPCHASPAQPSPCQLIQFNSVQSNSTPSAPQEPLHHILVPIPIPIPIPSPIPAPASKPIPIPTPIPIPIPQPIHNPLKRSLGLGPPHMVRRHRQARARGRQGGREAAERSLQLTQGVRVPMGAVVGRGGEEEEA